MALSVCNISSKSDLLWYKFLPNLQCFAIWPGMLTRKRMKMSTVPVPPHAVMMDGLVGRRLYAGRPGAGIMEADHRQVTTVFTVQPPFHHWVLDKPSIMKRYHRRRTCSLTSPRRSTTIVTLHDTRFVESRWWNDGWTVKIIVT